MAWLEEHPTSGHFKICFRFGNRKLKKTIKTTSKREAEGALARFEENLRLLERGRIELPPGADIGTFLLSDGKLAASPVLVAPPRPLLLKDLCDLYVGRPIQRSHRGQFPRHHSHPPPARQEDPGRIVPDSHLGSVPSARPYRPPCAEALPWPSAQCRHAAEGNGNFSGVLELGSASRKTERCFSRPWPEIPQDR